MNGCRMERKLTVATVWRFPELLFKRHKLNNHRMLLVCLLIIVVLGMNFVQSFRDKRLLVDHNSCVTKIRNYLERARKVNEKYKVFTELIDDSVAIQKATELDRMVERGKLHCMVIGIKDNIETSSTTWGLGTNAGSTALASVLPKDERITSSPAIAKLERQGVIILGKCNMDDFALQYHSFSTILGQTLNCHDPTRYPGGSSGGSAVAVSLGLVDFALGTDTGGSIRIPSSFAGIVGLRPSIDSVSTKGVVPLSRSRDTVGPLCRDVQTCRVAFETMREKREPCAKHDQKPFKVAIMRDLFTDDTWRGMQRAMDVLTNFLNGQIVQDDESISRSRLLKQTKSASMYEFKSDLEQYLFKRTRSSQIDLESLISATESKCAELGTSTCAEIVDSMKKKLKTSGSAPASAVQSWDSLKEALDRLLEDNGYDALALPAFTALPTVIGSRKKQDFCPNNRLAAITKSPSLVVFGGWTASKPKLPLGLEFVGRDECTLLALGEQFEKRFAAKGACVDRELFRNLQ